MTHSIAIALHALAAFVWLFLSDAPSFGTFLVGIVFGLALLFLFRDLFQARAYLKKWSAGIRLLLVFLRAFVQSNAVIAWAVLTRRADNIHPRFLTYDISHLSTLEILLLTHCVTLTPGTTSVDVSADKRELIIHAFDGDNPEAVRQGIRNELEAAILRFTR
jgi:multicomponent Na+:H+ antiporter subunit E